MFNKIEMQISQARVIYLQNRLQGLREDLDSTIQNMDRQNERKRAELDQLNIKIPELEARFKEKEIACEEKQKEVDNQSAQQDTLKIKAENLFSQSRETLENKNRLEARLSELRSKMQDPNLAISQYRLDIVGYQNIIKSREPSPQYRIDGEYCINGIYHCQNHPPRQILTNGEEIEKHRRAVVEARNAIQRLTNEIDRLQSEYSELQQEFTDLSSTLALETQKYEELQNQFNFTQNNITENEKALELAKNEYFFLMQEKNNIGLELKHARENIANLDDVEISILDKQFSAIHQDIDRTEQELEQEQAKIHQMLEKMAEQELMKANEAPKQSAGYSNSNTNMLARLKEMARRELATEGMVKKGEEIIEKTADKLVDKGLEALNEMGAISEQTKKNLKFIKSFGYKKVDELNQELEDFQRTDSPSAPKQ